MKHLKKLLPHATIVLSLMTLTFFVINQFNTMMGFMTSKLSQWVFALLALAALLTSVRLPPFLFKFSLISLGLICMNV